MTKTTLTKRMITTKKKPRTPSEKDSRYKEIKVGMRVEFYFHGLRAGRVIKTEGRTFTILDAENIKRRIHINQIRGYWYPKMKSSPDNLVKLRN